jgi:hypothetical protein
MDGLSQSWDIMQSWSLNFVILNQISVMENASNNQHLILKYKIINNN